MSSPSEIITVQESRPLDRLDVFLRSYFPTVSRGALQRLINEGHVLIGGRPVKSAHAPRIGEEIEITWPSVKSAVSEPEAIPLEILFEDEDLLVLNKAPGIVVHPAAGHPAHTLVNALLHHCEGRLSGIGGVARPGIVHRLDKDTSGCLIVAKNDLMHVRLSASFADRTVKKTYEAVVCGELAKQKGEIRVAIGRHPTHRKRMATTEAGGRPAWTRYEVIEVLRASTHVRADLLTGRTHQIRVHFHHLGHPLAGDQVYGLKQNKRFRELTGLTPQRQLLHASQIVFKHPRTGQTVEISAPIPRDFEEAILRLRNSELRLNPDSN